MKLQLGKFIKKLVGETLQSTPAIGTFVTSFKEDTDDNPKGKIKVTSWFLYRIGWGIIVSIIMAKGLLTNSQIELISNLIGL